jgi:TolA-binding protein
MSAGAETMQVGTTSSKTVTFSILLWAAALAAIAILIFYLWRRSPVPRKTVKAPATGTLFEEKLVPPPSTESGLSQQEVEQAFRSGVELVQAGKASEGMTELSKVIRARPENDLAWFWLGLAYVSQKDLRSAERCFLQAKRHGHPEADKALEWLKGKKF